jgi:hypothetical protein
MKFDEMVGEIMKYESDTFSADVWNIKVKEAKKIAESLLQIMMDNYVDGIMLDSILEDIRDENE